MPLNFCLFNYVDFLISIILKQYVSILSVLAHKEEISILMTNISLI